jgi:serine/threonine-protein kinase
MNKKYYIPALISAAILAGVFSVAALYTDKIVMPGYARTGEEYPVPDVRGYSMGQARQILEAEGFRLSDEITEKTDYDRAPGVVLEQYPRAGAKCKPGRKIYATVSIGALPVIVPELIGLSPQDAKYRIAESRLYLDSLLYEFSTDYPEGVVMGQTLVVNDSASIGDSIMIVISVGKHPSEFVIPNLKGKILSTAAETINKSGFKVAEIVYMKSEDYLPNTVLDQKPAPGEVVYEGAEIRLLVSTLSDTGEDDNLKNKFDN